MSNLKKSGEILDNSEILIAEIKSKDLKYLKKLKNPAKTEKKTRNMKNSNFDKEKWIQKKLSI